MNLDDLFKRKLLIVSGKGGVGKTTIAATLGLAAAKRGLKTLLVEVHAAEKMAEVFSHPAIGYQETLLRENLFSINVDPHSAFEEYVVEQIHSKRLYHLVFENRFVRSFLDATPGLSELLEIGKIWTLAERDKKYDLTIVDAPATGHGLAFLTVPKVVASAVRVGPIKNKAAAILKLLQDETKTLLILTTLLEEMPVNETLEMLESARSKVGIAIGPVIANAIFPTLLEEEEWEKIRQKTATPTTEEFELFTFLFQSHQKRRQQEQGYLKELKGELGDTPLWELPYLFRRKIDLQALEILGKYLP